MNQTKSELRTALDQLKPFYRQLFLLSIVVGLLGITPIAYMREVYGPVVTARSESALAWVTLLLIFALVLTGILEWIRQRVQTAAATKLTELLGSRALEVSFAANLQGRKSANAALNDLRILKNFMVTPVFATIFEVPIGFLFLGLIYFINPLMGTISIFGGVLMLVIGILAERAGRPMMEASMEAASRASSMALETTRNAQAVEAMGMGPAVMTRWSKAQAGFLVTQAKASDKQAVGMAMSRAIMLIQGSSMIGIGTALTLAGYISPAFAGLFIVAKFVGAIAMRPFMTLIMGWRQVDMARQAFLRLDELLQAFPHKVTGMTMPPPQGHLVISNAVVRPPGGKLPVVQGLNFDLHPGQILVVMGASGSGKSSLARLVTGLWPCSMGEARLDGVSLASWNKEDFGQHVGYLPQEFELFDGSIKENISRFGDFDAQAYKRVVSMTGLEELFSQLPSGDETELGVNAAALSGGQRQRVGLARALYGAPQLIVLDEPNSNLDSAGDQALWTALKAERARGATIVLITHRSEIVRLADRVLILKDGVQALFGTAEKVREALDQLHAKRLGGEA